MRFGYLANISVVVESDIKCTLVCRIMVFGKDKYPLSRIDELFDRALRSLTFSKID